MKHDEDSFERVSQETALRRAGYDSIDELAHDALFSRADCPALCEAGCIVEPDGVCPHGHESVLRAAGMI